MEDDGRPLDLDRAVAQRVRELAGTDRLGERVPTPHAELLALVRSGGLDDLGDVGLSGFRQACEETTARLWSTARDTTAAEVLGRAVARDPGALTADAGGLERFLASLLWKGWQRDVSRHGMRGQRPLLRMPAQEIAARLSSDVFGQPEATRAVALLLWHHARGQARSLVVAGPSGSGKTALARAMEGLWPDTAWVDGASLTKDGWSGSNKLSNMFRGLRRHDAEHAIVVIDEADKLFEPRHTSSGEDASKAVQAELLKYMDGGVVQATLDRDPEPVSCRRVSFVLLGSFEWLLANRARAVRAGRGMGFDAPLPAPDVQGTGRITKADLVRYGSVRREVAGRVMGVAMVRPLTADDYLGMLRDHVRGPVARLESEYRVDAGLTDDEARRIAEEAAASGLGVRSLVAQLEARLDERVWADTTVDDPIFGE